MSLHDPQEATIDSRTNSCAFTPNGDLVCLGGTAGGIKLLDCKTNTFVEEVDSDKSRNRVSETGKRVAHASKVCEYPTQYLHLRSYLAISQMTEAFSQQVVTAK